MMASPLILIWATSSSYVCLEWIGSLNLFLLKAVTVSFLRKTYSVLIDSFPSIPRTIVYSVFVIKENFTLILIVLLVYAHRP